MEGDRCIGKDGGGTESDGRLEEDCGGREGNEEAAAAAEENARD